MTHVRNGRNSRVATVVVLALLILGAALLVPAAAPAQGSLTGTLRPLTTDPAPQIRPSISGDIVAYLDYRNGNADVYYVDLATDVETRVTTSEADEYVWGVSGKIIVWFEGTVSDPSFGVLGAIKGFVIGQGPIDIAAGLPSLRQAPAVDGTLVAWVDFRDGNGEIYAKDLATGVEKRLTNSPDAIDRDPAVSGRRVAWMSVATTCQIFVADFDTGAVRQITDQFACHRSPDISGDLVVYDGNRGTGHDIYVYNLATNVETRIDLPGLQRNAKVSGNWVAFEDLNAGNIDIRLYHVPTASLFTVVATAAVEYFAAIDGTRVVFTSDAAGNWDIWLFEFEDPFASGCAGSDTTPPTTAATVSPSPNANGWNGTPATVGLAAADDCAGVREIGYALAGAVTGGGTVAGDGASVTIAAEGTTTLTYFATDLAGNTEAPRSLAVKVDTTPPAVGLTCPATVTLRAAAAAVVSVTDAGSGVAAQSAPDGPNALDTATVGAKTFEVTATDRVGHEGAASCAYRVIYDFLGAGGFKPPVANPPAKNTAKAGSTIPVKWQLPDGQGGYVSDLGAVAGITVQEVQCAALSTTVTNEVPAATTGGSGLRYDTAANQYIYNWKTDAAMAGRCFALILRLDDGSEHRAYFALR